jgi:thiosulfate/3-mercaptopyruvate sulfurtransferase
LASPLLVSTEELARHPEWRVFDCRHDLFRPNLGEQQYAKAHIPGARFAHMERDLSGLKRGNNGRHPLPEPRAFAAWLGSMGLRPQDRVVCYDANNGTMAARLWWLLRWMAHEDVALLDGGLAQWAEDERPLISKMSAEVPAFAPTDYPCRPRDEMLVNAAFVEQRLGANSMLLVDARAQARYRGEQEPIDPVAGRIPGAVNRFVAENLAEEGCFKSVTTLRGELGQLLGDRAPQDLVHYCGSGVAACHNIFAMELAGFPGSRLYPGSWSEWIADPQRPREKG